jgi:hypothetical protein
LERIKRERKVEDYLSAVEGDIVHTEHMIIVHSMQVALSS